jgi:hypothetical protein
MIDNRELEMKEAESRVIFSLCANVQDTLKSRYLVNPVSLDALPLPLQT